LKTPWGPLGYITYKRTYARRLKEDTPDSPTEELHQAVERVVNATKSQLRCNFTSEEEIRLTNYMLQLKGIVAGRFLWQLGTKTVNKLGLLSLQNCAAVVVDDIKAFAWTMDALMLGSGVGFNIQREYVYLLPKPKKVKIVLQDTNDADFIVPDSREGWIKLLEEIIRAHFETGKSFSFSTVAVRGKGTPIKGFGGLASGPEELKFGMLEISRILNTRAGKKLRPIDVLDVMNVIGYIVVSGNVRRSAQLALGDCDDLQFLSSKNWSLGNVPNHRAMSNNSVVCNDISILPPQFWDNYNGGSEPFGLINLHNSRGMGRVGEIQYPDPNVAIYNPCAEQSLESYETCCLAEIFLPNIASQDELFDVASLLYRINKHSLALPCHQKDTEAIVHKNMRMGIGVTGYLQASVEQKSWLSPTYERLREFDKEYSARNGFPTSIKITTVKPSGTLSLLAGVTPGIHPAYAQYYIRRIRVAANSNLVALCRSYGYDIEFQRNFDGSLDHNTVVVSFPCKVPEGTVLAKDMTAVDQLEVVKRLQTEWSDNAVSCTIYYRKEELPIIKEWLNNNYNKYIKSVSFLLHSEHGFDQAPYEETTKEQYEEYAARVKPLESGDIRTDDSDSMECLTGACPVK
jgi:ribonucleotide reductase alpha subunit